MTVFNWKHGVVGERIVKRRESEEGSTKRELNDERGVGDWKGKKILRSRHQSDFESRVQFSLPQEKWLFRAQGRKLIQSTLRYGGKRHLAPARIYDILMDIQV